MTNAIDGLVSGLNTTSLINSLMTVEAQPQALLKASVAKSQTLISALQGLNGQVAALATLATTTSKRVDPSSSSASRSKNESSAPRSYPGLIGASPRFARTSPKVA